jgi:hypothetical protein
LEDLDVDGKQEVGRVSGRSGLIIIVIIIIIINLVVHITNGL